MKADPPVRQSERLAALRRLAILDTPRERDFDEIAELASRLCGTPIAVINLVDEHRQWFKAEIGLGIRETPLETSICAHAILQPGLTVIRDTLEDPRLLDNPLCAGEPHLRFYAGALLSSDEGLPLGTLCVLDHQPRDLDAGQRFALDVLARQVVTQLKLRQLAREEALARSCADQRAEALEDAMRTQAMLVREIDHRVKNSLQTVTSLIEIQRASSSTEETRQALATAGSRLRAIAALHSQLHLSANYDLVEMDRFLARLVGSLQEVLPENIRLTLQSEALELDSKRASALGIIVNELVTNAVKHGYDAEARGRIEIGLARQDKAICLRVADDGRGMADRASGPGSGGIGLKIVEASTRQLNGRLEHTDLSPGTQVAVTFDHETSL